MKSKFLKLWTLFLYRCSIYWLTINEIAPSKEIRIKNNNQDWFDREVADLIPVGEKLFLKFKKSKLHIDEEIYQKIRDKV